MAEAPRDQNHVTAALFESSTTPGTTYPGQIVVATGRVKTTGSGGGAGTVTQIDTGTGLTGGPITTTGTIQLATNIAPIATLGSPLQSIRVNAGGVALEYYTPTAGTVTSVSGTANRITSTGGATPVIDISAAYVGQTSITTLGTITTGTLGTGAVIAGVTMTLGSDATGDIYYRSAGGVLTRLAIGSSTNVLTVAGGLPSWAAAPAASLVVGTTAITSGTTTRILYDNGGVLGEYTLTGTGTVVVMQTSPTLITPALGVATATSIAIGGATLGTNAFAVTGTSAFGSQITPAANDGAALGTTALQWSDLFLASGGVINFANGNVTLTQSSGVLTLGGSGAATLALGTNSITMTGSIAATGARVTKGWFTDIESTNTPTVGGVALPTASSTTTFTNKTLISTTNVVEEITTTASSATPTPTGGSLRNFFTVTALATGATFAAPSGTPANANRLVIRIKDSGSGQTLAFNAIYRAIGVTLPSAIAAGKTMYLGAIYNSADSKWDVNALATEA